MLVMYPDFDACTLITVPFFSFFLSLTVNFPFLFAFTVYFFEPTVTVTFDFLRDVPLITFFPFLYEVSNFHSYYNGHIGYEVFKEYRGKYYAYKARLLFIGRVNLNFPVS